MASLGCFYLAVWLNYQLRSPHSRLSGIEEIASFGVRAAGKVPSVAEVKGMPR
jgi:hypothetical protein